MKQPDNDIKRAIFAWHLIYDAAFMRSLITFGFKTMTDFVA